MNEHQSPVEPTPDEIIAELRQQIHDLRERLQTETVTMESLRGDLSHSRILVGSKSDMLDESHAERRKLMNELTALHNKHKIELLECTKARNELDDRNRELNSSLVKVREQRDAENKRANDLQTRLEKDRKEWAVVIDTANAEREAAERLCNQRGEELNAFAAKIEGIEQRAKQDRDERNEAAQACGEWQRKAEVAAEQLEKLVTATNVRMQEINATVEAAIRERDEAREELRNSFTDKDARGALEAIKHCIVSQLVCKPRQVWINDFADGPEYIGIPKAVYDQLAFFGTGFYLSDLRIEVEQLKRDVARLTQREQAANANRDDARNELKAEQFRKETAVANCNKERERADDLSKQLIETRRQRNTFNEQATALQQRIDDARRAADKLTNARASAVDSVKELRDALGL